MNKEGDVVLVYFKDQPTVYARIEYVEPDVKKDWFRVTLQLFTIPIQVVTWILRAEYINGEAFTMGGNPMRLERINPVSPPQTPEDTGSDKAGKTLKKPAKVLPFKSDR
ncbi:MAG: hypothetical protein JW932_00860 [Deltaproteobacteria bacterium]|nr:hypothetical protein [Deltaproteobacteria bacterium]